jgi:2-keto-3-deoxy-L-rhamnonate aldolase RhmA
MSESFSARFRKRELVYGSAVVSSSPLWPQVVQSCGLDFVFLDGEHMPLGRSELAHMCQAYKAMGIAPVVRLFKPDPYEACKALDGGATGIVAPYVEDVEQIRAVAASCKWKPLKGKRLERFIAGEEELQPELSGYLSTRNQDILFIANIESVPAMMNLDAILAIKELDGIFIGPHDLSCSLGLPEQYDHPLFEKAVDEIIRKAAHHHVAIGIHFSGSPQRQIRWIPAGLSIIVHSSDMALFSQRLTSDLEQIREAVGSKKENDEGKEMVI